MQFDAFGLLIQTGDEQKQFEEGLAEELSFHMCLTMAQWLVQILSEQPEHKVQNCMGRHWLHFNSSQHKGRTFRE